MKLTDNQLPAAQTSGNMVTLNMGISDNPEDQLMILNVLSSTLYTKKPDAVLREYGCNAFDANVEAGKGHIPIEVGLPNKLEPSLRIRDFGAGMTEEQIANTFVKLGRSTKRESNEFTGMLGIGSKAGFAYGDSFMVTSFTNGTKVVYNAFRDRGAPRLARMISSATTEPDGIEIKVPVRMEHFEEFRVRAERIYRYFKVRPKLSGALVEYLDAERLISGTGWHYMGKGSSVAIMGNVGYDLQASAMGVLLPYAESTLIGLGVELEFKIGELDITASREGLQYTERTKRAVAERLPTMIQEVGASFTTQISSAPSLWLAKKLYGDLFEKLGNTNTRSLKDVVDGQVKWKNQLINTGRFIIHNKEADPEVNVYMVSRHRWNPDRRTRESDARECYAADTTTLVINDLPNKKLSPARERGFFEDPVNAAKTHWVVFTFQSDAAQQRYWKARGLEGAPTINMSSITPAVTATQIATPGGPSAHSAKHSARAFVLDETPAVRAYGCARSLYWNTESVELDTGNGSYVVLDGFWVKLPVGSGATDDAPDAFLHKIKILREAGLLDGPVYGFKVAVTSKLGKNWLPLQDVIQDKLRAVVKRAAQEAADYLYASSHVPMIRPEHRAEFPKGGAVRDHLELIWKLRNPKDNKLMTALLQRDKLEPWVKAETLPQPSVDLAKLQAAVYDVYPVLKLITDLGTLGDTRIQTVADYIRLVESA